MGCNYGKKGIKYRYKKYPLSLEDGDGYNSGGIIPELRKFMTRVKVPRVPIPRRIRLMAFGNSSNRCMDWMCFCCGVAIKIEGEWECGHVISHSHGGKNVSGNMRPLCRSCNRSMGSINMYEYMVLHGKLENLSLTDIRYFTYIHNRSKHIIELASGAHYTPEERRGLVRALNPRKVEHSIRANLIAHIDMVGLGPLRDTFRESLSWKKTKTS